MVALNRILLMVLMDLERRELSAAVSVQSAKTIRVVHVARGQLAGADSNLKEERVGDMLISDGLLDPVLLEPIATEAAKKGVLLGEQLVADGLLSASDLAGALERQGTARLARALSMRGAVTIEPPRALKGASKVPLSVAVVAAFRQGLTLDVIEDQLDAAESFPSRQVDDVETALTKLELGPAELRIARRLMAGERPEAVTASGIPRDPVLRLTGALTAIGLRPSV